MAALALRVAHPPAWRGLSGQGTSWRRCLPSPSGWRPPFRALPSPDSLLFPPLTGPWAFWVTWRSWLVRCIWKRLNKLRSPQTGPRPSCQTPGASSLERLGTLTSGWSPDPVALLPAGVFSTRPAARSHVGNLKGFLGAGHSREWLQGPAAGAGLRSQAGPSAPAGWRVTSLYSGVTEGARSRVLKASEIDLGRR